MTPNNSLLSNFLKLIFIAWFMLWASYSVFKSPQPLSALIGLTFFISVMFVGFFALKMLLLSWAEKEDFVEYTSNYIKEKVSGKNYGDKIITSNLEDTLSEEEKVMWNMMIQDMEISQNEEEKPKDN